MTKLRRLSARAIARLWRRSPRVGQVVESLGAVVLLQLCLIGSGVAIARSLGPSGRGEAAVVLALPPIVMQIVCVGFPSALTYYIAQQPYAWRTIAGRAAIAAVTQIIAGLAVLFALNVYFLDGKPDSTFDAGLVAMLSLPTSIFLYYAVHVVQGLGDIRWFNFLRVGAIALYSGGIVAVSLLGLTVMRCAIVWSASQGLVSIVALIDLIRRRQPWPPALSGASRRPPPAAGTIAKFALSGFLAQVSPIESFRIDTLIVAALFPARIVGYYAVANSVTNAPLFAADALVSVGYPHVSSKEGCDALLATRRYMKVGGLLCGAAGLSTAAALPVAIPLLFGAAYRPSIVTGEFLAAAAVVLGLRRIGNDFLRALGRPSLSTRLELVTLAALAVCVAIIGRLGGGRGVAVSLIVAALLGVAIFWRVLRDQAQVATGRKPNRVDDGSGPDLEA
jgi:O-antigen/teichoic acid export membrane protein